MNERIQAIYENGVLRPLQPLDLDEHAIVWLSVEKRTEQNGATLDGEIVQQQLAVGELLERMERMTVQAPSDGFSNRDHDQVLYPKTR